MPLKDVLDTENVDQAGEVSDVSATLAGQDRLAISTFVTQLQPVAGMKVYVWLMTARMVGFGAIVNLLTEDGTARFTGDVSITLVIMEDSAVRRLHHLTFNVTVHLVILVIFARFTIAGRKSTN